MAGAKPQQVTAILLRLDAHHGVAAAALLAGLRAHQQPHVGLNGADQGLQMLAFALKTGLLAQVEVPAGEDVELLLRLLREAELAREVSLNEEELRDLSVVSVSASTVTWVAIMQPASMTCFWNLFTSCLAASTFSAWALMRLGSSQSGPVVLPREQSPWSNTTMISGRPTLFARARLPVMTSFSRR